jgi:hypothetical protein
VSRGALREAREWLLVLRTLWRLRRGARRSPVAPPEPGAPRRPTVARPDDDPALRARLGRWSRAGGAPGGAAAADPLTAADAAEAARTLLALRARMSGPAAEAIDAHLEAGRIGARRLRPADGYVWEMPGLRLFAIVGVQAFTVEDGGR